MYKPDFLDLYKAACLTLNEAKEVLEDDELDEFTRSVIEIQYAQVYSVLKSLLGV